MFVPLELIKQVELALALVHLKLISTTSIVFPLAQLASKLVKPA